MNKNTIKKSLKKQLPEALRKKMSELGKRSWQARMKASLKDS